MRQRILAMFLVLAVCLGIIAAADTAFAFSDVTDSAVAEAVSILSGMGIVDGYSDGGYHPADTLTRAQFCKLAILLENRGDAAQTSAYRSLFSDLSSSHWAVGYVNLAYEEGLVSGYGDGNVGPDDPVTTAQAVTILLHVLGYENDSIGPFWPEDYLSKAAKLGLLDDVTAGDQQALNRGEAALLLYACLKQETADGKDYLSAWASSAVESAVVLSNDDESADGSADTALVYAGGSLANYRQTRQVPEALVGRRGTLLLDKSGKVCGFVPDETQMQRITLSAVDADGLTDTAGRRYRPGNDVAVLLDEEKTTYSQSWYDLEGRSTATLYYSAAGKIDLMVVGDGGRYDGVLLTGYYESVSPNSKSPSTVTLLGTTFDVADGAKTSLAQFGVGDRLTVALNSAGEVAAAYSTSERRAAMAGILTSLNGTSAQVSLSSGIVVSGTVSSGSSASDLVGGVVTLTSSGVGKLTISTSTGGTGAGRLDVLAGTLGQCPLADDVTLYDQVGKTCAVEVELGDLAVDAVAAADIAYVQLNAAGEVEVVVLEDVTGNCYTYGLYVKGTQSSGSGDMLVSNHTLAIENSDGTTATYLIGSAPKGTVGGLAPAADDRVAALASLTEVSGVGRSDFSGSDTVAADGTILPISTEVQVYYETTDRWMTLEEARAFSDAFTIYYDRTPQTGGQVRIIVVNSARQTGGASCEGSAGLSLSGEERHQGGSWTG